MRTQQMWSENKSIYLNLFPSSVCRERQDVAWVLLDRTMSSMFYLSLPAESRISHWINQFPKSVTYHTSRLEQKKNIKTSFNFHVKSLHGISFLCGHFLPDLALRPNVDTWDKVISIGVQNEGPTLLANCLLFTLTPVSQKSAHAVKKHFIQPHSLCTHNQTESESNEYHCMPR